MKRGLKDVFLIPEDHRFHGQQHRRKNSYEYSHKPLKAPNAYTDAHIELFRKLMEDDGVLIEL